MDQSPLEKGAVKRSTFLSQLPESSLQRLLEHAQQVTLDTGQILIAEGSQPDCFYVVIDGDFEILKYSAGQNVVVSYSGNGEILGEMSLIENTPRSFTVKAVRRSVVQKIDMGLFNEVVLSSPSTALALLRTVIDRLRVAETMLKQQEKLASLGTLAAGLAHELNNPAAAAQRSTNLLKKSINSWLQTQRDLDGLVLEPEKLKHLLSRFQGDIESDSSQKIEENLLDRSDRESSIQNWLENQAIDSAWEISPLLTDSGWDVASLEGWFQPFPSDQIPVILRWLAMGYDVHNLLGEIATSTAQISEIVAAVKQYSYLDQAPQKEIDIHDGLESTLVILKHKLRPGITVNRQYSTGLPTIEAYAGELNQLWTNLIDNAVEAMQGFGKLILRTYQENEWIVVEVKDNGPGIPEQIIPRLFEPFFTTKMPGSGTGLGLHISYSIVQKHRGRINVHSTPGDTCFKVSLPIKGIGEELSS
jgi:signal transduction histidine kinase